MNSGQYKKGQTSQNKGTKNKTGVGSLNYPKGSAKKWTTNNPIPKSKYKGVSYKKQEFREPKWQSQICVNYKQIYLGSFPFTKKGELLASKAYESAKQKYF